MGGVRRKQNCVGQTKGELWGLDESRTVGVRRKQDCGGLDESRTVGVRRKQNCGG